MSTSSAVRPITVAALLMAAGVAINYGCSRAATAGNQGVAGGPAGTPSAPPGRKLSYEHEHMMNSS